MRLSIRKKGLLIVAVPLLFQFVFVGWLLNELDRAEKETLEEVRARAVISAVDRLFVNAYRASGALYIYAYTVDEQKAQEFDDNIKRMRAELRFLKENSKHDKKMFAKFEHEMNAGIESLKDQKRLIEADQHPGNNLERLEGYMRVKRIVYSAQRIADVETAAYGKPIRSFDERSSSVRRVMIAGLIGNLIIAFGIAGFFARNIEERLKRVLTNLDLFSKREKLLPPIVVTDEIGVVDNAFHDMARKLRNAERMKQDFVAMIGHDIRTPAATIKSTLSMLDEEFTDSVDPALRELVTDAAGESRRLMTLTNNLLDLTQIELGRFSIDRRPIQLADAIDQSVRSLALYAQSKKTTITNEAGDFVVDADKERLLQVLINLLSNAVKYSAKNSEVIVSTGKTGDFVEVKIEDNGPGIPEALREKIFETHERAAEDGEDEQHGMGLGLAICKSIIVAHGGVIGVGQSRAGGSAFWFRLPLAVGTTDSES